MLLPDRRRSYRLWAALGAAVAIALVLLARVYRAPVTGPLPAPPPSHTAQGAGPVFADFVGSETCGDCHATQYAAWGQSTHGRAGGAPPSRARVIAPFDGRPMRFRDALVTPRVTGTGAYVFTVAQRGLPVRTYTVDAVVGGGLMAGGGTQAFFSRFPDGTLRFLPFDYSQAERVWFCNTLGRANRGWVPVTTEIALADCGDWPPGRTLGSSERMQSCQQCHGSQIEVGVDTATRRFESRFVTLAINCESCHGPGRRHVDLARSGGLRASADIGMPALGTMTTDQSLTVCFQCHAAKAALEPGYLPGKPLLRHFALMLPLLLDTIYFADGRTRSFAYQEGHLASDCYLNGSMTCVDCHDPHTQRYRDVNGSALPGRFSNGQCLGCHPSKAEPVERHTHHRAESRGSLCVSCHMPYLQQPNVGRQVRYARSDHVIPIPRPALDAGVGIDVACRQCHADRGVTQLEAQVAAWYGERKPQPPAVAAALAADTMRDAAAATRTILSAAPGHAWAEFVGLTQVFQRYASPDLTALEQETVDQLERRARSTDPDVAALALATLHLTRGSEPRVRRFLAARLRALGPKDDIVRARWIWVLRVRGANYLGGGRYDDALATYLRMQELAPDDPAVLRSLGMAYTRLRDYPRAVEHFRRSLARRPDDPQVLIDLGFALMQQGDIDGAIATHRRAIAASPWEPGGHANLGVAFLRAGDPRSALEPLTRAVELDPGLAEAHFALASAYASVGRVADARAALRRGLEFDPNNPMARRLLERLPL